MTESEHGQLIADQLKITIGEFEEVLPAGWTDRIDCQMAATPVVVHDLYKSFRQTWLDGGESIEAAVGCAFWGVAATAMAEHDVEIDPRTIFEALIEAATSEEVSPE